MTFRINSSTVGGLNSPSSVSQLVDAAETPIFTTPENISLETLQVNAITTSSLQAEFGTSTYQTLGVENIVHPPTNSLLVGGVNMSVLNKRTRTSQAAATACVSTWTFFNTASDNYWRSVVWSPELSMFCAVASWGVSTTRCMTSPDGVNWTTRTTIGNNWASVCWSPELGIFCAVGQSGTGNRVMTSPDGVNWTSQASAADNSWYSICWSPELGIFCAVAYSGSENRVMTSPDGVNWTLRTSPADNKWASVCWSPELGIFCAVADSGSGNRVMTSPDGVNWTLRTSPADNGWWSVCWSPELGIFCAVADSGSGNRVMTSPDGVNWTLRTSATNNTWISICWSPELSIFCAVATLGAGNRVMTSPDGVNWTSWTNIDNIPGPLSWSSELSICWSPELSIFCAVSVDGNGNRLMTSAIGMPNSQSVLKTNPSYMTVSPTGNVGISNASPAERLHVTGNILASGTITPFTGAHITPSIYSPKDIGKLVSSTGHVADISINNAWPRTQLSFIEKDSSLYGVISEIKDNGTALVNGVGEGAIWVCDRNGAISIGDLLTSSSVPGYSQKQENSEIYNYTAARAIMNCSFDDTETKPVYEYEKIYTYHLEETVNSEGFESRSIENAKYYIKLEKNEESETVNVNVYNEYYIEENEFLIENNSIDVEKTEIDETTLSITFSVQRVDGSSTPQTFEVNYSTGQEMFVVILNVTERWQTKKDESGEEVQVPSYNIKYVDKNGDTISFEEYHRLKGENVEVYMCGLIGCIYLCG